MAKIFLLLALLISVINDAIVKVIGEQISVSQVIFFRFLFAGFFSFISLRNIGVSVRYKDVIFQIKRGILGGVSFFLYTYSLTIQPLINVVAMSWLTPIFSFFFAIYFLKETFPIKLTLFTIIILIVLFYTLFFEVSIDLNLIFPIIASILFAVQDIMIKTTKIHSEKHMILIFSITLSLASLPFAAISWIPMSSNIFYILFLLGAFTMLMQYFLIKAFKIAPISNLVPLRYIEIVFSALVGFIFFQEVPSKNILICSIILLIINVNLYKDTYKKIN